MKLKRIFSAAIALCLSMGICGALTACKNNQYQIAIFAYQYDDSYITTVRNALSSKFGAYGDVKVTFYNGNNNQQEQSTQIDTAITKGADLLIINAVDFQAAGNDLAQKCKDKGKPAIFFNREISDDAVNKADNICFVGTDPDAPGHMLGEMIANLLSTDEAFRKYDLNGDGKIQYAMFRAEVGNAEADGRTKYSVDDANKLLAENTALTVADKNGNVLQRVGADQMANWSSGEANTKMSALFQVASDVPNVELVICNNDDMALGAISALNDKGYNNQGSKTSGVKYIPVYGVDALSTALDAIRNGKMEATVKQDGDAMAEAIVKIAMNIKAGKSFLEGTDYKFETGVRKLRIPYAPVTEA